MKDEKGRAIVCGKCGSGGGWIYVDYIPGSAGMEGLACNKCGEREGSRFGFKVVDQSVGAPLAAPIRRKEGDMEKIRGMCSNCKRPDLMVEKKSELCGSCLRAITNIHDPAERKLRLSEKAKHLEGKPKMTRGKHAVKSSASGAMSTRGENPFEKFSTELLAKIKTNFAAVDPTIGPNENQLTLVFRDDDRPLFDSLAALAKRFRRDPAQQVMWMLQHDWNVCIALGEKASPTAAPYEQLAELAADYSGVISNPVSYNPAMTRKFYDRLVAIIRKATI